MYLNFIDWLPNEGSFVLLADSKERFKDEELKDIPNRQKVIYTDELRGEMEIISVEWYPDASSDEHLYTYKVATKPLPMTSPVPNK